MDVALVTKDVSPERSIRPDAQLEQLRGMSPSIQALRSAARRAARSDLPVLIEGPTGAGKDVVARIVHQLSARGRKPFVALNCGALPAALFESELFGHARGAFTGAATERRGLAVTAEGGTLFLDEIAELPLEGQAKLLRFLQSHEVRPVGADHARHVNVRVLAATNRRLEAAVARREFRDDLYYRIAVTRITVPPLRDRQGDVAVLAKYMVEDLSARFGLPPPMISPEALVQLEAHTWPGNVRELENVVARTLMDLEGDTITSFDVWSPTTDAAPAVARLRDLLTAHRGNLAEVARKLGVSRPTLYKHLRRYALRPSDYRRDAEARKS
jgi:DNA-binding NtrC family response regulator